MPGRDRRPQRAHRAGWMEPRRARLELARGLPDPALYLDALDECGQDIATVRTARLGQRERPRERGGKCMVGRAPHGLEVEHVHGCAIERRCGDRVQAQTVADRCRLWNPALLLEMRGKDLDRVLLGPRDSDSDAVEHQPSRCGGDRRAEIGIAGGSDLLAELRCHGHERSSYEEAKPRGLAGMPQIPAPRLAPWDFGLARLRVPDAGFPDAGPPRLLDGTPKAIGPRYPKPAVPKHILFYIRSARAQRSERMLP